MTKNDRDGQGWRWSKYPPSKSLVIPPSFHHSSIILSVKSIHPNPSAEGFGWTDFMLSFGYYPWLIHFIPGPSHHSRITFLILSVKSVHPNPSAEGFGWTELTLPFGYHPWLIHFIPGSSLHWHWHWHRNDAIMTEWPRNDVMTSEWWYNEGMTQEWWNDIGTML